MTDIDIEGLKAKAKAAPPGPWRVESGTTLIWGKCDPEDNTTYGMGIPLAEVKPHPGWGARQGLPADDAEAAAHFIAAANPSVVLALIARVERAEALADLLEGAQEEISRLRALLARAGEALKPFHLLAPFEARGWADEHGWTDRAPKNERICDWFGPTDFRTARTVSTEIEKEIGHD